MRVAIAQLAPVFLDRERTLSKVVAAVDQAADRGARLVCFGETLVPAYPMWISRMNGARWNAPDQKRLHAAYVEEAVCIAEGHLAALLDRAAARGVAVVIGVAERDSGRGHSIFCSRIFIGGEGTDAGRILSIHRKLMPTYDEKMAWAYGDGAGLVTHRVGEFTVGALNCWENWMPLTRAALYAAGETLHVAIWPGSSGLTRDITRFIALESRSFVVSACNVLRESDIPADTPERTLMKLKPGEMLCDGGSCIAAPDGSWLLEPQCGTDEIFVANLDAARVVEERQNFDPAGHYARPDVLRLLVNRRRHRAAEFET